MYFHSLILAPSHQPRVAFCQNSHSGSVWSVVPCQCGQWPYQRCVLSCSVGVAQRQKQLALGSDDRMKRIHEKIHSDREEGFRKTDAVCVILCSSKLPWVKMSAELNCPHHQWWFSRVKRSFGVCQKVYDLMKIKHGISKRCAPSNFTWKPQSWLSWGLKFRESWIPREKKINGITKTTVANFHGFPFCFPGKLSMSSSS